MAYNYIERAYGKRFEAGQRVRFTEYKGERGLGVVRGVRNDPQYVRVLFDDGTEGPCHPGSLEIIEAPRPDDDCHCSPEDVHNYGPCGAECRSLISTTEAAEVVNFRRKA